MLFRSRHWILRILIDLGGVRGIVSDGFVSEPQLLKFVGVAVENDPAQFNQQGVIDSLRERYQDVRSKPLTWPEQTPLLKNLRWLQTQLGLSELEVGILLLCVLERHYIHLAQAMEATGTFSNFRLYSALATLLDAPVAQVAKAKIGRAHV